jgi:Bacterial PH domain
VNSTFRVAPYSMTAWVWTLTFIAGLVIFIWRLFLSGVSFDVIDLGFTVLLAIIVGYGYMRSVRSYRVTDDQVQIIRSGPGRINIDRADIASVEAKANLGSFFNMSILGTGGLFGWAGRARIRNPTDIRSLEAEVFGTNPANSVLMQLRSGRKLVLTPADPAAFVAAIDGPRAIRVQGSRTGSRSKSRR